MRVSYPNTGSQDIFEYDENGLVIRQLSLSGDYSLFGGLKKKLTIFKNDHYGNILVMEVRNAESAELLFTQKNEINSQGDEVESIGYNADNSIYSFVQYEYTYDNYNNWITKQTLTSKGHIYQEEQREINYYS
jgi:hypothetical protein